MIIVFNKFFLRFDEKEELRAGRARRRSRRGKASYSKVSDKKQTNRALYGNQIIVNGN